MGVNCGGLSAVFVFYLVLELEEVFMPQDRTFWLIKIVLLFLSYLNLVGISFLIRFWRLLILVRTMVVGWNDRQ